MDVQVSADNAATESAPFEVADLIVAYLERIGVEYVFGVPGGAIEPIYNALGRRMRAGGKIRPIVARHENGAAFMAEGYTRETGRLGVCVATSGPGATNMITGVACAHDNGIPMLAITGQPALPSHGRGALQESADTGINTLGMFLCCTHYNSLVSHPDQARSKLLSAIRRVHQQPKGAAHLSFPVDVLRAPVKRLAVPYDLARMIEEPTLIDEGATRQVVADIKAASRIVMILGADCTEAIEPLLELAEMVDAKIITSPDGKGLINQQHRLFHGVFGFAGHYSANAVLWDEPDLILAIGTSLGEWTSGAWSSDVLNERLVHIAASELHLLRSPMARMHVRGRLRTVAERIVELLRSEADAVSLRHVQATRPLPEVTYREPDKYESDATPIKPQRLMRELSERCPPTARLVADAGNSMAWAIHYFRIQDRRRVHNQEHVRKKGGRRNRRSNSWLRVVMDFAPMGWAIGNAIGMARGNPKNPVICLTGDGSYLMSGQEITVAAEERLSVVFIILNDRALGMVKHGQRLAGAERISHTLPEVDYRRMAESMGIPGFVIKRPEDFDLIDFDAILRRPGPTLLDVHIDGEEVPPMSLRMQTLGTERKSTVDCP
ncbi:MAG: thiamine pyrophosphate-binding protein [Burkholderiales bacterium]|nr:thiamine pyrophosphate-binding protein [Burkholderiales bacterium]